tara:strand:- start:646 stop:1614 length:969 start_codon:yes stop_codon:yes gene_type:complete
MLHIDNPRTKTVDPFTLNNWSETQLAQHLKISKNYFDLLKAEQPDLLAYNINDRMKHMPKDRLFRTMNGTVRAFLSNSYKTMDIDEVFMAIWPIIEDLGLTVRSAKLTERHFYLKCVHTKLTGEIGVGQAMCAGFMLKTSDVGGGSFTLAEWIEELICTNGWVAEKVTEEKHLGRKSRVGSIENSREYFTDKTRMMEDKTFVSQCKDTVSAMFNPVRFEKTLDRFRKAKGIEISAPLKESVEVVSDKFRFNESESNGILEHLSRGGDPTKFGLAAAITRTAEDLKDYDRSTEFEGLGTRVVDMSSSEWSRIETAAIIKAKMN